MTNLKCCLFVFYLIFNPPTLVDQLFETILLKLHGLCIVAMLVTERTVCMYVYWTCYSCIRNRECHFFIYSGLFLLGMLGSLVVKMSSVELVWCMGSHPTQDAIVFVWSWMLIACQVEPTLCFPFIIIILLLLVLLNA